MGAGGDRADANERFVRGWSRLRDFLPDGLTRPEYLQLLHDGLLQSRITPNTGSDFVSIRFHASAARSTGKR